MSEVRALVNRIRGRQTVTDAEFDALYPDWVRRASEVHWTPYDVATRAAELLVRDASTRVLDVGSGAGKLCVIGSLVTEGLFFGIEQRAGLVEAAEQTAERFRATRCHFIHGDIATLDWGSFDAFYLYNPFYEHVTDVSPAIEEPIELIPALYTRYVTVTRLKLRSARFGTRVVTYQGFGGEMPEGYQRLLREPAGCEYLELWSKEPASAAFKNRRLEDSDAHFAK